MAWNPILGGLDCIGADPEAGPGTVTSVGVSGISGVITVTGSPVTTSGTIALSLNSTGAGNYLRNPAGGSTAAPTYGPISAADLPASITSNTSGSAATLTTPRLIGNVSFNGSANITPQQTQVVTGTDSTSFVGIYDSATGNLQAKTSTGLTYNASTGTLTATGIDAPVNLLDSTDPTSFILMANSATGAQQLRTDATGLTYDASTGTLTATGGFIGNSSTATALAANPTNCSPGEFPLGIAASGAAESCTALPTSIAGTANEITASGSTGSITLALASALNLSSKTLRVPNSNSLPGSCGAGEIYIDNDATGGERFYYCEGGTFVSITGGGSLGFSYLTGTATPSTGALKDLYIETDIKALYAFLDTNEPHLVLTTLPGDPFFIGGPESAISGVSNSAGEGGCVFDSGADAAFKCKDDLNNIGQLIFGINTQQATTVPLIQYQVPNGSSGTCGSPFNDCLLADFDVTKENIGSTFDLAYTLTGARCTVDWSGESDETPQDITVSIYLGAELFDISCQNAEALSGVDGSAGVINAANMSSTSVPANSLIAISGTANGVSHQITLTIWARQTNAVH